MSCESNTPLASKFSDLFLKSDGPFSDITARGTGRDTGDAELRSLVDSLLFNNELDTGSGSSNALLNQSGLFDANGNLVVSARSAFEDGTINTESLGDEFKQTSEVFNEIKSFARRLDLSDPFEVWGRDTITDLTDTLNDFLTNGGSGGNDGGSGTGAGGGGGLGFGDGDGSGIGDDDNFLSDFPNLDDRLGGDNPNLTYVEVGDWVGSGVINPVDLLTELNNGEATLGNSAVIRTALISLDDYYTANLGKSLSSGLCGGVGDIFKLILKLLNLFQLFAKHIDLARSLLASILDLDFKKLIIQLIQRIIYETLRNTILDIIAKIYNKIVAKVQKIRDSAMSIVAAVKGSKQRMLTMLNEICRELNEFYSDDNLETFLDKLKKFIDKLALEFERFTLENIAQLIYRLCNFLELIEQLLCGPALGFQDIANKFSAEDLMMRSISLRNTKRAVEFGALRLSPEERKQQIENARLTMNENSASFEELIDGASTDYKTAKEITSEEIELLFCLDDDVPPHIKFTENAAEPYREKSPKVKNFMRTKPIVFARLIRMSKRTEIEYNVIEAYNEKETDKEEKGATENTIMQSGCAINVKIEGGFEWVAKTIISASQEGFVGIGVHNDYIHLDIGPRESVWVAGYTSGFTDADSPMSDKTNATKYANLLERHVRREFTKKVL